MNQNKKVILILIALIGLITPFVPSFVVIQMFYLLIPFGLIFIVSLIYLAVCLFKKDVGSKKGLFLFSIVPIFLICQIISGLFVDKIQLLRSNQIIAEIEMIKDDTGIYPEKYDVKFGITYHKIKKTENYEVEYSRGFMVTEKYQSEFDHWRSFGWND